MTEEELEAIDARCEAATPGPWVASTPNRNDLLIEHGHQSIATIGLHLKNVDNNGDFIAHSRADVPALVAYVRKLEKSLNFYREEIRAEMLREQAELKSRYE